MRNLTRFAVIITLAALAASFGSTPAAAGEADAGTFGAPSLNIPVGAKLMAAPDVVAGMQPDASLLFSNPAFVSSVVEPTLFFSTSNWLDDLRFTAASTVVPIGKGGWSLAGGATFLYSGDLAGYDDALNVVAEENYYDLTAIGALSRRFPAIGLSVSAGATYLRQHVYPSDGNGYSFSAGAVYEVANNFFHASLNNFGGSVSFPGASYTIDSRKTFGYGRVFNTGHGDVLAGAQVVAQSAAPTRLELGVAYKFTRLLSVRTAVKDVLTSQSESVNIDAGFSIDYNWMSLDYAYTQHEYFSSTHTFSLSFRFRGSPAGPYNDSSAPDATESSASTPGSGQTAPSVVAVTPESAKDGAAAVFYLLIAGTHATERGAQDEARSFQLVDVNAKVGYFDGKYHVVLGRYASREKADEARRKLGRSGNDFRIVVDRTSR